MMPNDCNMDPFRWRIQFVYSSYNYISSFQQYTSSNFNYFIFLHLYYCTYQILHFYCYFFSISYLVTNYKQPKHLQSELLCRPLTVCKNNWQSRETLSVIKLDAYFIESSKVIGPFANAHGINSAISSLSFPLSLISTFVVSSQRITVLSKLESGKKIKMQKFSY